MGRPTSDMSDLDFLFQPLFDKKSAPKSSLPKELLSIPATSFVKFGKLPGELRNKIWGFCRFPRYNMLQQASNSQAIYSDASVPALLHTCRESRTLALGWYELSFPHQPRSMFEKDPSEVLAPAQTYFDWENGGLYSPGLRFGCPEVGTSSSRCHVNWPSNCSHLIPGPAERARVKKMVLEIPSDKLKRFDQYWMLAIAFRNLEECIMLEKLDLPWCGGFLESFDIKEYADESKSWLNDYRKAFVVQYYKYDYVRSVTDGGGPYLEKLVMGHVPGYRKIEREREERLVKARFEQLQLEYRGIDQED